jgi:hypothetical protein
MRNDKALAVLRNHRMLFEDPDYDSYYIWQQQGLSYIERFLGKESREFKLMDSIEFPNPYESDYNERIQLVKHILIRAIDQSIQTVQDVGIIEIYHNFLSRYSDKELIAGIVPIAIAIFAAGIFAAKYLIRHDIIQLF